MTETVTTAEAARRLGITRQAIGQWAAKPGAPCRGDGMSRRFAWPDFPRWREAELARVATERAAPADLEEARARREAANAELAELDLAERRRELVTTADVRREVTALAERLRAVLAAFPSATAPRVVGLEDVNAARLVLHDAVQGLIHELRAVA